ncbi:MAG: hypothetical protein AAGA56_08535 [Myxococcota bacterium]
MHQTYSRCRLRVAFLLLLLLVLGTSCGEEEDGQIAPAAAHPTPWQFVAEVSYQGNDATREWLSEEVLLQDGGGGVALFVETDGCAELALLADVDREDNGAPRPPARFSPVAGSGLFVYAPTPPVDADAVFQLRRLDCTTMTPARSETGGTASIWYRRLPSIVETVRLPIVFHHGKYSHFADTADELRDAVDALMHPAGIEIDLVASVPSDALPARIAWSEGRPENLAAVRQRPREPVANIFFAGCLERVHPATGRRHVLDGLVPRVPGIGTAGAGVFLRGRECGAGESGTIAWSLDVMAHRIAHELGHLLGLFHTVEADGLRDDLSDTDDGTLMALRPTDEPTFSPQQAERMRLYAQLLTAPRPR